MSRALIKYVDKALAAIEVPIVLICGTGIIAVLLYGAINRYIIHGVFPEEPELAWLFHMWLVFLGGSLVLRGGDHPYVGIIREKRGKLYKTMVFSSCIAFATIMLYATLDFYSTFSLQKTTFLRLPMTVLYAAMILGFLFIILRLMIKIYLLYKPTEDVG